MSGSARGAASIGLKFTTRPELIGTFGPVSSTHWLASAVGMSILERGGNAFDTAVAMGFTLQIVEPHLRGPAGDMPAILYSARDRAVRVTMALLPLVEFFKAEWPSSAAVWLPGGQPPRPRTLFVTTAVAQTYKRILAEAKAVGGDRERQIEAARNAFYCGFVAEAIDRFATRTPQMDGSGRRNVALLTAQDMANWRATLEEPVSYDYGRYRVHKTGPWGQGPVLLQQLALLKGFDLDTLAYDGADFVHVVTECSKLAFADREAFYGDPAYSEAPVTTLLGDAYNNERRRLISKQASMELRPGLPSISAAP